MSEIFDIILSINKLRAEFVQLNKKISFLLKYSSVLKTDKLVSQEYACKYLNISLSTIIRLRNMKEIDYVVVKGRIKYSMDSLENYRNLHTIKRLTS